MPRYEVVYDIRGTAVVFIDAEGEDEAEANGYGLIDWHSFEPSSMDCDAVTEVDE